MNATTVRLNEIDRFMWLADCTMRAKTGRGNTCVLVLTLDRILSPEAVAPLIACEAVTYLSSLRLEKRPFKPFQWKYCSGSNQHSVPEIQVSHSESIEREVGGWDILPTDASPIQLKLIQVANSYSALAFLWHHSLFDAHGAERFIQALLVEETRNSLAVKFPAPPSKNITLRELQPLKNHILRSSKEPVWYPSKHPTSSKPALRYQRINFTAEETEHIDALCQSLGAELFRSCVYIALTARAVRDSFRHDSGDLYIPVPHDTRKTVKGGVVGGNQLSFFFFRVKHTDLDDLPKAVDNTLLNTQQMIEQSLHKLCRPFFRKLQVLPAFLYRKILESPTGRHNASFYLSDTGNSLSNFRSFGEATITDANHFPPNFCPPGLTFVFSRYHKRLRVVIISDASTVDTEHANQLQNELRSVLLSHQ